VAGSAEERGAAAERDRRVEAAREQRHVRRAEGHQEAASMASIFILRPRNLQRAPAGSRRSNTSAQATPDRLVDAKGRPYFLWDEDLTIDAFRSRLRDPDPEVRAYYLGKLMRQAKPDDVFTFVTLAEITELFPLVARYLGRSRDFWTWLLGGPSPLHLSRILVAVHAQHHLLASLGPLGYPNGASSDRAVRAAAGVDPDRRRCTRRLSHKASRDPRSRPVLPPPDHTRVARGQCDACAPGPA
jgi:hypothetical protein